MRWLMSLILMSCLTSASLIAQDPACGDWIKPWDRMETFIPEFSGSYFKSNKHFKFNDFTQPTYPLPVLKSPVKHAAIFCHLEDLTLKKFGIMFQFHVGDYNSYMDRKIPR